MFGSDRIRVNIPGFEFIENLNLHLPAGKRRIAAPSHREYLSHPHLVYPAYPFYQAKFSIF